MTALGLDTSNYTTSAALFDGAAGENAGRLLTVREGELGLRQNEALFQHITGLPALFSSLREKGLLTAIGAVGASTRPRAVEGSYMPCFLAGESQGRVLAEVLGVPFFPCSHQEGHIAAAAWSARRMGLLDAPHLAWHLSGGTTELLLVQPDGPSVKVQQIGGTTDLSAGQLIDRTGLLLGLPFPAGRALDALAADGEEEDFFPVKVAECFFSLSGVENQVKSRLERGEQASAVARFALNTVARAVQTATAQALQQRPGLPVLCSGGVAASRLLRARLTGAAFAAPAFSADNAMGVAILTWRALMKGGRAK